jgi:hypothetical protein
MKYFLIKLIRFALLCVVFIELASALLLYTKAFVLIYYPGKEVYNSIDKSREKSKVRKLLIGDSVGNQLFSNEEDHGDINSIATNQAISFAGQYFLVNDYLKSGNKIDTLFMVFVPWSFKNNLDQIYTYHYFLKPFNNSNYSPLFTETLKNQINKIEYNSFSQVPHIKITSWAPEYTPTDPLNFTFISPISVEYLDKIKSLSLKHNFDIIIIPPPISNERIALVKTFNRDEITKTTLSKELNDYFDKITYIDSTKFLDGTHLINPLDYKKGIISDK